jgi:hypothetical protein
MIGISQSWSFVSNGTTDLHYIDYDHSTLPIQVTLIKVGPTNVPRSTTIQLFHSRNFVQFIENGTLNRHVTCNFIIRLKKFYAADQSSNNPKLKFKNFMMNFVSFCEAKSEFSCIPPQT